VATVNRESEGKLTAGRVGRAQARCDLLGTVVRKRYCQRRVEGWQREKVAKTGEKHARSTEIRVGDAEVRVHFEVLARAVDVLVARVERSLFEREKSRQSTMLVP
jgi:hypothetical protein